MQPLDLFPLFWLIAVIVAVILLIVLKPSRHVTWLVLVLLMVSFAGWVSDPDTTAFKLDFNFDGTPEINSPVTVRQGLDLAGGLQVLLEADAPAAQITADSMNEARRIINDRIDSLGALEPVVQLRGGNRIIIELPGYQDPEAATSLIRQTALLEFVECPQGISLQQFEGEALETDYREQQAALALSATPASGTPQPTIQPTVEPTAQPTAEATPEVTPTPSGALAGLKCHTVMTGEILTDATPAIDSKTGQAGVTFTLTPEGSTIFGEYTRTHVGRELTIVLDGLVVSSPVINGPITGGTGQITGKFTRDDAIQLATQLRYGALPVPLKVQSTTVVGPTLGQVSVERSIRAGIIGISVVLIFMLVYYRLPGIAAALALISFALLSFMFYKIIPITLTLPAITGFLISVGTAVDGNILIFERMKEELRRGKGLDASIEAGFARAWTSIRDSNLSTLIICAVLVFFGSSFGAGAVSGFAVALALGLVINLFTATIVTRTFLHFIFLPVNRHTVDTQGWLFGL